MGGAEAPLVSPPCLAGQQGWRDLRGAQSPVQHGDPPGQNNAPHTCQDCQIFLKYIPAIYGMWLVTLLLLYSLQEGKRKKRNAWDISHHSYWMLEFFLLSIYIFKLDEMYWRGLRCMWWFGWFVAFAFWCIIEYFVMSNLLKKQKII